MNDEYRPMASEIKAQKLPYPASQADMRQQPAWNMEHYRASGKLLGKKALITGADSGIGRSVAIAYAMEGADVAFIYNVNDDDAEETLGAVTAQGQKCLKIKGDVTDSEVRNELIEKTIRDFGGLNILINNAHFQASHGAYEDIDPVEIEKTFSTNILAPMLLTQLALRYMKAGDCIINTGSIVGLVGIDILIPYSATKSAIHAFTKSLALHLGPRGIRVNCVVPGPIWTPNIPGTMPASEVENFGHEVALKRPGQPEEVAPAYVFLASEDASFVTGALYEVTGGRLSQG
ncbi:MAG: SDR family oxidoreductase [Chitinophagaceae bacterium]|nr:SDR family oxidoreductase [Oligoflexus sp.]